jgi:hypothetical protein
MSRTACDRTRSDWYLPLRFVAPVADFIVPVPPAVFAATEYHGLSPMLLVPELVCCAFGSTGSLEIL